MGKALCFRCRCIRRSPLSSGKLSLEKVKSCLWGFPPTSCNIMPDSQGVFFLPGPLLAMTTLAPASVPTAPPLSSPRSNAHLDTRPAEPSSLQPQKSSLELVTAIRALQDTPLFGDPPLFQVKRGLVSLPSPAGDLKSLQCFPCCLSDTIRTFKLFPRGRPVLLALIIITRLCPFLSRHSRVYKVTLHPDRSGRRFKGIASKSIVDFFQQTFTEQTAAYQAL